MHPPGLVRPGQRWIYFQDWHTCDFFLIYFVFSILSDVCWFAIIATHFFLPVFFFLWFGKFTFFLPPPPKKKKLFTVKVLRKSSSVSLNCKLSRGLGKSGELQGRSCQESVFTGTEAFPGPEKNVFYLYLSSSLHHCLPCSFLKGRKGLR